MALVNSLPIRTLFSRSTSFKWENIRSTDTCVQGKQLMIRDTGCTIRGCLEIMSQTFGSFNFPSHSTSTIASANAVRSDFADAVADASAPSVECTEFKYASKSDTVAASLPLQSVSASALSLSLEVFRMCAKKLTEERSLHVLAPGCSRGFSIEYQPIKKENKMIISLLYKSVNSDITNRLGVILDLNKIKCTNAYQYWVEYNINKKYW